MHFLILWAAIVIELLAILQALVLPIFGRVLPLLLLGNFVLSHIHIHTLGTVVPLLPH